MNNRTKFAKQSHLNNLTVCMVSPYLPRAGGIAVQTHSMVAGLESEGVKVLRVDTILHKLDRKKLLFPLRIILQPLVTAARFLRSAPKADVIHIHACSWWGFVPVMVCAPLNKLFTKKRLVISFHGARGHIWIKKHAKLARYFFGMADDIVVVSPQLKEVLAEEGIQTRVLWNLVDLDRFSFRERRNIKPNIAWIRHFEDMYDPMTALRVYEKVKQVIPDVTITFIGDGSLHPQMDRYICEHNLTDIHFTGRLSNAQVPIEFDKADIFLNTSKDDGLPTALLEASAAGFPLVTTNAGGIPCMLENGKEGIIVPVGDIDALANEIIGLIRDPKRAAAMSVAARHNAERYGWAARVEDMEVLYGLKEVTQ